MPRPVAVIHPGPRDGIVRIRAGGVPIHRGAVIHQGDACVAPTFAAIIAGPRRGEACLALVPSFIPVRGMASSVPAPGFIPIHRGAVIHQGDACVAPTFGTLSTVPVGARHASPWCRHSSRSGVDIIRPPCRGYFHSPACRNFHQGDACVAPHSMQCLWRPSCGIQRFDSVNFFFNGFCGIP